MGRKTPNKGWFRKGADPRRHRFSKIECIVGGIVGFRACCEKHPEMYTWLRKKARACTRRRLGIP